MRVRRYCSAFRPNISAACLKISASIRSFLFSLRRSRNSFSSSLMSSPALNDPLPLYCLCQLLIVVFDMPYSLDISLAVSPPARNSAFCRLKSAVYVGWLLLFGASFFLPLFYLVQPFSVQFILAHSQIRQYLSISLNLQSLCCFQYHILHMAWLPPVL